MPNRPMSRPRARVRATQVVGGATAIGALIFATAYAAHAEPEGPSQQSVDQAKAQVLTVGAQVAALDAEYSRAAAALVGLQQRASAFAEAANGAKWELDQATTKATKARGAAKAAGAEARGARSDLRAYAAAVYQQGGPLGTFAPVFEAGDPQELIDRASALELVGANQDARLVEALHVSGTADTLLRAADAAETARRAAADKATKAERIARDELALAGVEASRLSRTRASLAERLAGLRDTSARLEKERLDAIAREAQANQEASRPPADGGATPPRPSASSTSRPASSTTTRPTTSSTSSTPPSSSSTKSTTTTRPPSSSSSSSTPPPPPPPPPSSSSTSTPPPPPPPPPPASGAAAAIAYASAQLGKPYEWAAEGPDSFDCSGLTMMAWRQAGVYLSHYTGAQWAETTRVPIDQLAPGDLVFFGSSGPTSHHVGLYIGGGQMIEAPYTGAYVRYASIYRSDLIPYGGRPG